MSIASSERAIEVAVGLILLIAAIALLFHISSTDSRTEPV